MFEDAPRICPSCGSHLELDFDFTDKEIITHIVCNNNSCDRWVIVKEYSRELLEEN